MASGPISNSGPRHRFCLQGHVLTYRLIEIRRLPILLFGLVGLAGLHVQNVRNLSRDVVEATDATRGILRKCWPEDCESGTEAARK